MRQILCLMIFLLTFSCLGCNILSGRDVLQINDAIQDDYIVPTAVVGDIRVDIYEVTIDSYCFYFPEMRDLLESRIIKVNPDRQLIGDIGRYPALVHWEDAVAYVEARGVRLPTVDEYKYLAEGNGKYRIGNILPAPSGVSCYWKRVFPKPVDYNGVYSNGYGLNNMFGNATEWTSTKGDVFGLSWDSCMLKMKKQGKIDLFPISRQGGTSGFRCVKG